MWLECVLASVTEETSEDMLGTKKKQFALATYINMNAAKLGYWCKGYGVTQINLNF